jgi:hypothetical protein
MAQVARDVRATVDNADFERLIAQNHLRP